MTGAPRPPVINPAQAAILLDQVIDDRVLACIDLDALFELEQSLIMQIGELDGMADNRTVETARALVDHGLHRVPTSVRAYLQAAASFEVCELCDDDDEPGPAAKHRQPRASIRFNS